MTTFNSLLNCVQNSSLELTGDWRDVNVHKSVIFTGEGTIKIDEGVHIRSGAVIYGGTYLEKDVIVGHNTVIEDDCHVGSSTFIGNSCTLRPETCIGRDCTIGHLTVFEGWCSVGKGTLIHAQCHITKSAKIGNSVFIAPFFVGANDPVMQHRRCMVYGEFTPIGYTIRDYARIGISVSVLPNVEIGENAVVGVGSVVTKNVPPKEIWMGVPAKYVKDVPEEEWL